MFWVIVVMAGGMFSRAEKRLEKLKQKVSKVLTKVKVFEVEVQVKSQEAVIIEAEKRTEEEDEGV